jgi:hypothetical protein
MAVLLQPTGTVGMQVDVRSAASWVTTNVAVSVDLIVWRLG